MKRKRYIKIIALCCLMCVCLALTALADEEMPPAEIPVTDLDIDDVVSPMTVGSSQILSVQVLPTDATEQEVVFTSLTPEIATVNAIGRVRAMAVGTAQIQISSGDVSYTVDIDVVSGQEESPEVADIDVDYQKEMEPGDTQMLYPSVLPRDADAEFTYRSDNTEILSVNAFGRVTANRIGSAHIYVAAGTVEKSILITVKKPFEEEEEFISVRDIDIDTEQNKVTVGSSVMLSATVLPVDASEQKITYSSSDQSVLTVNDLGRVYGVSVGTATVTLRAGGVKKTLQMTVEEKLVVKTIEVSDFNDEMKVEDTQTLSVSLYPSDAEDQKTVYQSSDPTVATVSEGGVITAAARGNATITISAGSATKELQLKVYVKTDEIKVAENYLIMQPNEDYQIKASVFPSEAEQELSYQSTNPEVVTVSESGAVHTVGIGRASVIISNLDSSEVVTIIVNKGNSPLSKTTPDAPPENEAEDADETLLLELIRSAGGDTVTVSGELYRSVSPAILRELYREKANLCAYFDEYTVTLIGESFKTAEDDLTLPLQKIDSEQGYAFAVNEGHSLPCDIEITFLSDSFDYSYLYLRNEFSQKYERLNDIEQKTIRINTTGTYLLTANKIEPQLPIWRIAAIGGIALCCFAAVFVAAKRKYWFW